MASLYHRLLDVLGALCGLLIIALMLGVTADVAVRSVTGRPILWMFEVTEYVLLYIPCLGMAWLARDHGHVAITSFVERFPASLRRALATATPCFCAAVCLIVAYWGVRATLASLGRGAVTGMMLQVPEYLLLAIIPFGFGLAAVEFVRLALAGPVTSGETAHH